MIGDRGDYRCEVTAKDKFDSCSFNIDVEGTVRSPTSGLLNGVAPCAPYFGGHILPCELCGHPRAVFEWAPRMVRCGLCGHFSTLELPSSELGCLMCGYMVWLLATGTMAAPTPAHLWPGPERRHPYDASSPFWHEKAWHKISLSCLMDVTER